MYLWIMSGSPLRLLLTISFVLLLTGNGIAQASNSEVPETDSLSWYIQMKYGLDQELINGFQYYTRNTQIKGNPYFPDDIFYLGSVRLRDVKYDNVQLKYDIYSQHLILAYTDFLERYNQLILNNIHVDSFCLGIYCFHKLSIAGQEERFYQLLKSGPLTCYIHWKRDIHSLDYDYDFKYTHEYSSPIGTYYIMFRDQITPFTNRKSFISVFPESLQREIKKYCKQEHLLFKEAGPAEIQNLLNFVAIRLETQTSH